MQKDKTDTLPPVQKGKADALPISHQVKVADLLREKVEGLY